MNELDFEKTVEEAVNRIPEPFNNRIDNVQFQTVDEATEQQKLKLGLRACDALFGLYEGVPLPARGGSSHSIVPDVITIFRKPMVDMIPDTEELRKQIYKTVWHEVAHYFGLNHTRIYAIEKRIS
jgi:predicted Zn-dependent protease with MMP-like domain